MTAGRFALKILNMRSWNLKATDPRSLTLAADARVSTPDYTNDQIWELSLHGGEPSGLALQTTFGLRARSFRLFPSFTEGDENRTDPQAFHSPPSIRRFFPNYILASFSPFPGIQVESEYWAPQSHAVAGRIRLTNSTEEPRQIKFEWMALLTPTEGERMAPREIEACSILAGQTDQLVPVVFLTGGPIAAPGPYPSLTLGLELDPGASRQVIWSHAALNNVEDSFQLARETASQNWDAEYARIELLNTGQIEIHTGEPEWDQAFALSQKVALGLFLGPTQHLSHPSIVNLRRPDQGHSLRGDGSDYGHLWNGQSPIETYTILDLILPAYPDLAKGLLRNFLATQEESGEVDWRPGLAGQRGKRLATPLLAAMAWRIFQHTEDVEFLREIYPALLLFVNAWFAPAHDRDDDGVPEWDHPMQSSFDDHPIFARWYDWAQGVEISTAENPTLCAFLYCECQSLIEIAQQLGHQAPIGRLQSHARNLKTAVDSTWDPERATYRNRDRDTHLSLPGIEIGNRHGSGVIHLGQSFEKPVRLLLRVNLSGETTRRPDVFLHGTSQTGKHRVERLSFEDFHWYLGLGTATSSRAYIQLERIEIQGIDELDEFIVQSVSLVGEDITLLLPIWAEISSKDRTESIVERTITAPERYWRDYGMPAHPQTHPDEEVPGANPSEFGRDISRRVHIYWNSLIGSGLVEADHRQVAAELVARLMRGVIRSLKEEGNFRRYYDCDTGAGIGERDALGGLAPLGLFLKTLGVRLISPHRVMLEGHNPFPWPVTVKYRGLTILRQKENTQVIFPDGQTTSVSDPEPRLVALS